MSPNQPARDPLGSWDDVPEVDRVALRVQHPDPGKKAMDFKVTRTTNLTDFLWARFKHFRTNAVSFVRPGDDLLIALRIRPDATPSTLGTLVKNQIHPRASSR